MCKLRRPDIRDMAYALLYYRKHHTELSTYITGLPYRLVTEDADGLGKIQMARVHPTWMPFRTKSGRWGCRDNNMQNQAKRVRNMYIGDYLPDVTVEV